MVNWQSADLNVSNFFEPVLVVPASHIPGKETMSLFDEDVPKKPEADPITVGEDLSRHSENDLNERIEALREEINRTQKELEQRGTIRDAANSFFQK